MTRRLRAPRLGSLRLGFFGWGRLGGLCAAGLCAGGSAAGVAGARRLRPVRVRLRDPADQRQVDAHPHADGHRHGRRRGHSPYRPVLLHRLRRLLGGAELAAGLDLRLGPPPRRLPAGAARAGSAHRRPGLVGGAPGAGGLAAADRLRRAPRGGDRRVVLDAGAPAGRAGVHGAHGDDRRAPAHALAAGARGLAVGEQPRVLPARPGLARGARRWGRRSTGGPGPATPCATWAGSPPGSSWPR